MILLYDKYFNLCDLLFETLEPSDNDSKEIFDFKMEMLRKLENVIDQDINSKAFNQHDQDKSEEYKIKMVRRTLNVRR